ncbi:MAG TPA: alkaline phosphatase family protein, partial [Solirubrobacteraceae bacterium]|nr:alkaline phosphatase family protein [Solirubrobacteraceae bacterium]
RLPLLVISPWARRNYVDGTFSEQSSVTRFIEENWNLGKIGAGSEDTTSGTIQNMFDFNRGDPRANSIVLNDETGEVESEGATTTPGEGKEGKEGPAGPAGPAGPQGQTGPQGQPGSPGATGSTGAAGPAGPEGPEGKPGPGNVVILSCKVEKGKEKTIVCTETANTAKASGAKAASKVTALVSLSRNHKIVAHGRGRLGTRIRLVHKLPLKGRYTLFVEVPGKTSSSSVVRF